MGPDNSDQKPALYFHWPDGTFTRVECTTLEEFDDDESSSKKCMWRNEEITGHFRVRKFSRKTFKKYLMSIGFGRNLAEIICEAIQKRGWSYSQAYIEWIFYAIRLDDILKGIEEEFDNGATD